VFKLLKSYFRNFFELLRAQKFQNNFQLYTLYGRLPFQFNEQCKKPFKNYIIDFMRISSKNPELKFENKILDQLGLYPCQKCENKFMKQQL